MNDILTLATEFLSFLLQCFFWYAFWTIVISVIQKYLRRNQITEEEHRAIVKKVADLIHEIKPEKHGDITYWFDAETDQFLGQGKDQEEIRQHLLERFKGHVFVINDGRALAGPLLEEISIDKLKLSTDLRTIQ